MTLAQKELNQLKEQGKVKQVIMSKSKAKSLISSEDNSMHESSSSGSGDSSSDSHSSSGSSSDSEISEEGMLGLFSDSGGSSVVPALNKRNKKTNNEEIKV